MKALKLLRRRVAPLNQNWVRMKLELLERQQHGEVLEMVEVDD